MNIRNTYRVGDSLMKDDESGRVHYRSEMIQKWNGMWVRKDQYEARHPQEFVRAGNDPHALRDIRPDTKSPVTTNAAELYIGETTVLAKTNGPAHHLYDPGIGEMIIGLSFEVS